MEELYNQFEQYLDGDMPADMQYAFEKRLATDEQLQEQLNNLKAMRETLGKHWQHEAEDTALNEQFAVLGKKHFGKNQTQATTVSPKKPTIEQRIGPRTWVMAAALIALLGAVYFMFLPTEKNLYASYRDFPKANFTVRGNTTDDAMAAAEKAFNTANYTAALPHFQTYLYNAPNDSEAQFFYALSLMENDQYDQAQAKLNALSKEKNIWGSEAAWYLVLNDLKAGNTTAAKKRLEGLSAANPHFGEAQKLLQEL